jgi:hypothetical protein
VLAALVGTLEERLNAIKLGAVFVGGEGHSARVILLARFVHDLFNDRVAVPPRPIATTDAVLYQLDAPIYHVAFFCDPLQCSPREGSIREL